MVDGGATTSRKRIDAEYEANKIELSPARPTIGELMPLNNDLIFKVERFKDVEKIGRRTEFSIIFPRARIRKGGNNASMCFLV